MIESDPAKTKVYALYDSNRLTPSGVLEIEKETGLIHVGIEESILNRFKIACNIAWHLVIHKGYSIVAHTMQEKTEQEIADWYDGKGLK
jgi:hypothetical protein